MTDEELAAIRKWVDYELEWHRDEGDCDAHCWNADQLRQVLALLAEVDRLREERDQLRVVIGSMRMVVTAVEPKL